MTHTLKEIARILRILRDIGQTYVLPVLIMLVLIQSVHQNRTDQMLSFHHEVHHED